MKFLPYIWLFTLLPNLGICQLYPVETRTDEIKIRVIEKDGRLAIDHDLVEDQRKFPSIQSINLEDADLVLNFSFAGKKNRFSSEAIKILSLESPAFPEVQPNEGNLVAPSFELSKKAKVSGQYVWMDVGEYHLDLGEEYILTIERSIMEIVDCQNERPAFGIEKQWVHYAIAGGAVASIGLGEYFNQEKNRRYLDYETLWLDGAQNEAAQSVYDEAERLDNQSKAFTYGGIIVLGLDAALFLNRWLSVKDRQKAYDEFCIGKDLSLQIDPSVQVLDKPNNKSVAIGLSIRLQF